MAVLPLLNTMGYNRLRIGVHGGLGNGFIIHNTGLRLGLWIIHSQFSSRRGLRMSVGLEPVIILEEPQLTTPVVVRKCLLLDEQFTIPCIIAQVLRLQIPTPSRPSRKHPDACHPVGPYNATNDAF